MAADASTVPRGEAGVRPRLLEVLPAFKRHLRAENKAARTVGSYAEAVRMLALFLGERGMPLELANLTEEELPANGWGVRRADHGAERGRVAKLEIAGHGFAGALEIV